jgi:ABC-type phosphate transport system permease subunit
LGPNGLGSIPKEITDNFPAGSPIEKSALVVLGLILFITTLVINLVARAVVSRSNEDVL